jgi:hypothetical protein
MTNASGKKRTGPASRAIMIVAANHLPGIHGPGGRCIVATADRCESPNLTHLTRAKAGPSNVIRIYCYYHSVRGKTSGPAHLFHGRFVELVPNDRSVELVDLSPIDPAFAGTMTVIMPDCCSERHRGRHILRARTQWNTVKRSLAGH